MTSFQKDFNRTKVECKSYFIISLLAITSALIELK